MPTTCNDNKVQFRAEAELSARLDDYAHRWGIRRDEAARRLAVMAAYGLPTDLYVIVAEASVYMASHRQTHAFTRSCRYCSTILQEHPMLSLAEQRRLLRGHLSGLRRSAAKEFKNNGK